MRNLLVYAALFILWAGSSIAAPAYYQPVGSASNMTTLGTSSPFVVNTKMQGYYGLGTAGGGDFTFFSSCPGTPDNGLYFSSGGGCWSRIFDNTTFNPYFWGAQSAPTLVSPFDSTTAFQNAITAANPNPTQTGGTVPVPNSSLICPAGQWWINTQLTFGIGQGLYGTGSHRSCQFNLSATNATVQATGALNIGGTGSTSIFGTLIENTMMNMNTLNGIAYYGGACQDLCGFDRDFAYQVMNGPGILMDGTQAGGSVNTFMLNNDIVFGSQTRTAGGDGISIKTSTYPPIINGLDVLSYTGHLFTNFVHYNNVLNATGKNFTLEDSGGSGDGNTSAGVLIDGSLATGHIDGVSTQNVGNSVVLSPTGTSSMVLTAIYRAVSGTNTIVNTSGNCGPSQTITDVFVPLYVCAGTNIGIYLNGTDVHVGNEVSFNATKLQVSPDSNANPALMQFYSASGATGAALRNGIQMWDLSNNGWNVYNLGDGGDVLNFDSVAGGAATTRAKLLYPQGALQANGGIVAGGSAPTGSGTCTRGAQVGGNTAGTIVLTCTAQTLTLTFAQTAPNGWTCNLQDRTTPADTVKEASSTTTSWTSQSSTTAASDTVSFMCMAY